MATTSNSSFAHGLKLFPISLKMKSPSALISEFQTKGITLLLDARRSPIHKMNSREDFIPANFKSHLNPAKIEYKHVNEWGNYSRQHTSEGKEKYILFFFRIFIIFDFFIFSHVCLFFSCLFFFSFPFNNNKKVISLNLHQQQCQS